MNYFSDLELTLLVAAVGSVSLLIGTWFGLRMARRTISRALAQPSCVVHRHLPQRHDVHYHGLPKPDDTGEEWKKG